MCPTSKRTLWEWFSHPVVMRYLPVAAQAALASQRVWEHRDRLDTETATALWHGVWHGVVRRAGSNLAALADDGTPCYPCIDPCNSRCELANRGKHTHGRHDLRHSSEALCCSADGQLPLCYEG